MKRFYRSFLLGFLMTTLMAVSVLAQVTTTTLSGTITDPSGAAVPGAQVTVTNTNTGLHRTVSSNSTGNYVIADLPYGQYEVKVLKQGFNVLNRTGIILSLGTRQTLDLSLTVGSVTQAVTVSGQATQLKTRDASLGQVIGTAQIEALPVLGRSFNQLMYLIPGSQVSPTGQYAGVSFIVSAGPAIGFSFNGMRTEMNDYVIDGTETTYPIFGTPTFYPSLETLQEFRVETQNFSSEMSRTAGGQVMLYTKSGSNELHGSVYDYLRNDNLEARNPFSPRKPESKSNLFGATVGGPIKKNNTFFFAGYEGFRAVIPGTSSTTVPTQDDRNGILTDPVLHPNPIIDPTTGQPFQGNVLYRKRKTEALQGKKLPENLRAPMMSFAELCHDALAYSKAHKRSYHDDVFRMEPLLARFRERAADSITPQEFEHFLSEGAEDNEWAAATVNRYRALISLIYRLGIENGKVKENPARLVKHRQENNARVRWLTADEETRLRAVISEQCPEHTPELNLALNTGLRLSEMYGLTWENVRLTRSVLTVPRSKNGEMRHVPLNSVSLVALAELRKRGDGTGPVIRNLKREPLAGQSFWFEPAVRKAKIRGFSWHCLRHTFASRLVMSGVDIRTVQELMGHKSIQMTVRYAHLAPKHTVAAVERLAASPSVSGDASGRPTDTKTSTAPVVSISSVPADVQQAIAV